MSYKQTFCILLAIVLLIFAAVIYVASGWEGIASFIHHMPVWLKILLCAGVGGVVGGVLGALKDVPIKEMMEKAIDAFCICDGDHVTTAIEPADPFTRVTIAKFNFCCSSKRLGVATALGALGGFGGAMAGLFGMILADKLHPDKFDDTAKLTIFTTGIVAGFLGFQLLKSMSDGLATTMGKKLKDNEQKMQNVQASMTNLQARSLKTTVMGMANRLSIAWEKQDGGNETFMDDANLALSECEETTGELRHAMLLDPQIAVYRGLLNRYARSKSIAQAIKAIREHTAEIEQAGGPNKEWANVYYNLACYLSVQARETESSGTPDAASNAETLRTQAWAALKVATKLQPSLVDDAQSEMNAPLTMQPEAGLSQNDLIGLAKPPVRNIEDLRSSNS